MNPTQFRNNIVLVRTAVIALKRAELNMARILSRVERQISTDEPLTPPLTQAEVDRLSAVYLAEYSAAKADLVAAFNLLP